MRTKTLLIAAATLAVGAAASMAQTTYSQNVVGYANVATLGSGSTYYFLAVPFTVGSSNGANEIWPLSNGTPTLPDGSQIMIWSGTQYATYQSDSQSSSLWDDANGNAISYAPKLPVGQGFCLIPSDNVTNTFAGAVAVNVGTSNVTTLTGSGSTYYLVSPVVPYAGSVTNGNTTTFSGGPGLASSFGLPDGSQLEIWNGTGFDTYQSDSQSSSYWDDANGNAVAVPPSISVAQGFFLIPSSDFSWKVGL